MRTYDIQLGDVVSFFYDELENRFSLTVNEVVEGELEEKLAVGQRGVLNIFELFSCSKSCAL